MRHNQKGTDHRDTQGRPLQAWVCTQCKAQDCTHCIDVKRYIWEMPLICSCKAPGHSGEPRDQQIQDPNTGDVYAPDMVIKADGTVERNGD